MTVNRGRGTVEVEGFFDDIPTNRHLVDSESVKHDRGSFEELTEAELTQADACHALEWLVHCPCYVRNEGSCCGCGLLPSASRPTVPAYDGPVNAELCRNPECGYRGFIHSHVEDTPDENSDNSHVGPGSECEHTVVVSLAFKSYGNRISVERAIEELLRWTNVEKQCEVDMIAYGYTDHGSLITKNGTSKMADLIDQAESTLG